MTDEPAGARVRYLVTVEVGGVRRERYETTVTAAEADALVKAGRAEVISEPLTPAGPDHNDEHQA